MADIAADPTTTPGVRGLAQALRDHDAMVRRLACEAWVRSTVLVGATPHLVEVRIGPAVDVDGRLTIGDMTQVQREARRRIRRAISAALGGEFFTEVHVALDGLPVGGASPASTSP